MAGARARRAIRALGILGGVLTALIVGLGIRGRALDRAAYDGGFRLLASLPDSIDIEKGVRLTHVLGCRDCHAADLGGAVMIDAPPFLVVSANLTVGEGGVAGRYASPADWDRAIRYRVAPDGRGLLPMMPSENYHRMSDRDLAHVIAAIEAAPPVDRELDASRLRPMGLVIAGAGVLHPRRDQGDAPGGPTPEPAPDAAYGAYLASLSCVECHGEDLGGGPTPGGGPKAPALATAGRWSLDAFTRALREGIAPGERALDPAMPSTAAFRHLTDLELEALHAHLAGLPIAGS